MEGGRGGARAENATPCASEAKAWLAIRSSEVGDAAVPTASSDGPKERKRRWTKSQARKSQNDGSWDGAAVLLKSDLPAAFLGALHSSASAVCAEEYVLVCLEGSVTPWSDGSRCEGVASSRSCFDLAVCDVSLPPLASSLTSASEGDAAESDCVGLRCFGGSQRRLFSFAVALPTYLIDQH